MIFLSVILVMNSCKKEMLEENTEVPKSHTKEVITLDFENMLPTSTTNVVVKHENYILSYHEKYEQAEWVAYELKAQVRNSQNFKRPYFVEDSKVSTGSASWRNYKNSGYDKGHLCPAGDMRFSKDAFEQTFLTSNISPQKHDFNSGIWNKLEQKVRYWSTKYDGIFVVTGGILSNDLETIGNENVAVPKYFYKVLFDESNGKYRMIAFLVPANDSKKPLYEFVVSVNEIEKLTGIDFYPKLEDAIENKLEERIDYKDWSL